MEEASPLPLVDSYDRLPSLTRAIVERRGGERRGVEQRKGEPNAEDRRGEEIKYNGFAITGEIEKKQNFEENSG